MKCLSVCLYLFSEQKSNKVQWILKEKVKWNNLSATVLFFISCSKQLAWLKKKREKNPIKITYLQLQSDKYTILHTHWVILNSEKFDNKGVAVLFKYEIQIHRGEWQIAKQTNDRLKRDININIDFATKWLTWTVVRGKNIK